MGVKIEIELDEDQSAAFHALFCEVSAAHPGTKMTPEQVAKVLLLDIVYDDLAAECGTSH